MDEIEKLRRDWALAARFRIVRIKDNQAFILPYNMVNAEHLTDNYLVAPVWPDDSVGDSFLGSGVIRLGLSGCFNGHRLPSYQPENQTRPLESIPATAKAFAGEMVVKAKELPICLLMPNGAFSGVSGDGQRLIRWDNIQVQMTADDLGLVPPDKPQGNFWTFVRRYLEQEAKPVMMVVDRAKGINPGLGVVGEDDNGNPLYVWRK